MNGLAALEGLLAKGSTGEVVGAHGPLEVHAWLQDGRIAWATSSRAPRTFRQYLTSVCKVSDEHLSEVFAACRASHRPLGEELISRGIATQEQVVGALRQQVATALLDFELLDTTELVLLPRQWESQEHSLTFAFEEVVKRGASLTPLPFTPRAPEFLQQLSTHLPMLQWAAHTDGEHLTAEHPAGCGATAAEVTSLHRSTIANGAQLVLVRRPDNLVVGAQTSEGSAWGALSLAGPVTRALTAFSRGVPTPPEPTPQVGKGLVRSPEASPWLRDGLMAERGTLAVLGVRGAASCLAREGLEVERLLRLVTSLGGTEPGCDVALRLWPGWWFGARTEGQAGTLWLVTEARALDQRWSGGLSWARLHALARQLSR